MALTNMPQTDSLMREAQHMHDIASAILEVYAPGSTSPNQGSRSYMESLIMQTMAYFERELRASKQPHPFRGSFDPVIHPPY